MYDANRITILLHSQDSVNETRVLCFIHTKKRNRLVCATVMDVLLKYIAVYDSLTKSKKSAEMKPTLSGLEMRILTDKVDV